MAEDGTWSGYEINGRKRLLPAFADLRLGALTVEDIRAFVAEHAEAVQAGELAAKTVNNAIVTLVVCLNDAVEDGLIVANPALRVERLPAAHIDRDSRRSGRTGSDREPGIQLARECASHASMIRPALAAS